MNGSDEPNAELRPSPMTTKIDTRTCSFELDSRGFVRATMRAGVEMTLTDAREALTATWEIAGEKCVPVLVDARRLKSQTREARDHFAGEEAARACFAVALLIGSPVSRVIGNFFLSQYKRDVPHRLFTDENAAIDWLLGHRP